MTCPKCHGEMRIYERSGVTVDQCTECRGIFLDRGELEKLFEAEANFNGRRGGVAPAAYAPPPQPGHGAPGYPPAPAGYPPQPGYPAQGYVQPGHGQPGYHGHYRKHGHYSKKRRHNSFLGELFD